jgi:2,5-diketo-D-gluconate reductase B
MELITTQGLRMPKLGFGTWRLAGESGRAAIRSALALGYRHIDTAESYGNEADIGAALAQSPVPRADLHITSKVAETHLAPDALRRALETSLANLRTGYIDLYLIHWPTRHMDLATTLAAMLKAREEGLIRAIGVSNFTVPLMRQAVEHCGAPIACNQVEYHVMLDQSKVLAYANAHDICIAAYSPLARGALEEDPVLKGIARKHGVTPTQIGLKWLLDQPNVAAIPKAASRHSQQANLDALNIVLDDEDRALIARLPHNHRLVSPSFAPVWD